MWIDENRTQYNVRFRVMNQGYQPSGKCEVGIYLGETLSRTISIGPIKPYHIDSIITVGPFLASDTPADIKVCADINNVIAEIDESNNCIQRTRSDTKCFIATAASGNPDNDSSVQTLRNFRDERLQSNTAGSVFISTYYNISPPVADFIVEHPILKPIVKAGLTPAVTVSSIAMSITLAQKLLVIAMLASIMPMLAIWIRKKRPKNHISI